MNIILFAALVYGALSILFTYLVHAQPRRPVKESPDWGTVTDAAIPAVDGGFLEVWRIEPDGPSKGIVALAHGWSRNRDRMVNRARMFGAWGSTAFSGRCSARPSSSGWKRCFTEKNWRRPAPPPSPGTWMCRRS